MKRRLNSHQLEGWRAWFGCYSPGGVRTPAEETIDVLLSRLAAILLNVYKAPSSPMRTVRDVMVFPPPVTEEEMAHRIEHAKACLKGAIGAIRKKAR